MTNVDGLREPKVVVKQQQIKTTLRKELQYNASLLSYSIPPDSKL